MLNLKLSPDVQLCEKFTDYVYKGDNKISEFTIELPEKVGAGYKTRECSVEMRCYLPDGDYMSYMLDTSTLRPTQLITNDITEEPQSVEIMFIVTHGEDVIGKSNTVTLYVLDAPDAGEPLVPRGEADKVIKAQRQTIATQRITIEEQTEQIAQDSETINGLNTQVNDLTTENEALAEQNSVYLDTIDELNKRVPAMETPLPVTPTGETQVIRPSENYAGLASVTVDRVTAEGVGFNPDYYKEGEACLGEVGTYNPFPYESKGGIYITETDNSGNPTKLLITNLNGNNSVFYFPLTIYTLKSYVQECIFKDCENYTRFQTEGIFQNSVALKHIEFSGVKNIAFEMCKTTPNLKSIIIGSGVEIIESAALGNTAVEEIRIRIPSTLYSLRDYCMYQNYSLKKINLPNSITKIGVSVFGGDSKLEFVTIEPGFNCNNLNLSSSTLYSVETIVSWLEALADRTGETAYTLTMGATNLNKLTDEQKAIAIGKNWNLA